MRIYCTVIQVNSARSYHTWLDSFKASSFYAAISGSICYGLDISRDLEISINCGDTVQLASSDHKEAFTAALVDIRQRKLTVNQERQKDLTAKLLELSRKGCNDQDGAFRAAKNELKFCREEQERLETYLKEHCQEI